MPAGPFIGIDVGSNAFHAMATDEDGGCAGRVFAADEVEEVVDWASGARVIAVDAPDRPSSGAHVTDRGVAPKFREGRCAEVALGRQYGYWVSWVTPVEPLHDSWIEIGIGLHQALRERTGAEVIEVYPYACFRHLAGGAQLATKSSVEGSRARAGLLRRAGLCDAQFELWSHDSIDAAAAALVARDRAADRAVPAGCDRDSGCGQDGSAIWLPAPVGPAAA